MSMLRRFDEWEEHDRQRRARRKGHTQDRTFIVGGEITPALYVPPMFIGINADGLTPQWKTLVGFAAVLQTGSATLRWQVDGVDVVGATAHPVSTITSPLDLNELDEWIDLAHAQTVGFVIDLADSAANLSAAAFIVTGSS